MTVQPLPMTMFSQRLAGEMERQDITIGQLAEKIDSTYEHARKLARGLAHPSKYILDTICKAMNLDKSEIEKLVVADKIKTKFGKIPAILVNKNPELDPIERMWPLLSDEKKRSAILMIQGLARSK